MRMDFEEAQEKEKNEYIITEKNQWINIKNKLPDSMQICVCFMKNGHDEYGIFRGFFRIATFQIPFIGESRFYSDCEDITKDTSHWMPLPEPPK